MNAPYFGIKRFAVHDGPGIRTTLFLKGCPLHCVWCHNPEGIQRDAEVAFFADKCLHCGTCASIPACEANQMRDGRHLYDRAACKACGACETVCPVGAFALYGREISVEKAFAKLTEDAPFYGATGGITLSGGECLLHKEFCVSLLAKCKTAGISTAVDTCGMIPRETLAEVLPLTDLFLYDIKAIEPEVHRACTGADNRRILDNLRFLAEAGANVEIRIPFVPGWNDAEIPAIGRFLASLPKQYPVRLLPYHNQMTAKYESIGRPADFPRELPSEEALCEAKEVLKSLGLTVL